MDPPNIFVSKEDLATYKQVYGMNDCMYKDVLTKFQNNDFSSLQQATSAIYCSICGIKKKRKTRHCPNVASDHSGQPLRTDIPQVVLLVFRALGFYLYLEAFYLPFSQNQELAETGRLTRWVYMLFLHWKESAYFTFCLFPVACLAFLNASFHLLLWIYCISTGLTLDEVYNPHYYSYLQRQKPGENNSGSFEFVNENRYRFFSNTLTFFRQLSPV